MQGPEVVVVGAPDVLHQLVGEWRVPPEPGEPAGVPRPGRGQVTGRLELLQGQVAHRAEQAERQARGAALDGEQVRRRQVTDDLLGAGRVEAGDRARRRQEEGPANTASRSRAPAGVGSSRATLQVMVRRRES